MDCIHLRVYKHGLMKKSERRNTGAQDVGEEKSTEHTSTRNTQQQKINDLDLFPFVLFLHERTFPFSDQKPRHKKNSETGKTGCQRSAAVFPHG